MIDLLVNGGRIEWSISLNWLHDHVRASFELINVDSVHFDNVMLSPEQLLKLLNTSCQTVVSRIESLKLVKDFLQIEIRDISLSIILIVNRTLRISAFLGMSILLLSFLHESFYLIFGVIVLQVFQCVVLVKGFFVLHHVGK